MPYIPESLRESIKCSQIVPNTPGELNYKLTEIVHRYIEKHGISYTVLNEVIGVLECAKLELYRMIAAPYENEKRSVNGPVSKLDKDS